MPGRLAIAMVVGGLLGVTGCGKSCDCGGAVLGGKAAEEAEICSGLSSLSGMLGPVRAISPSTTTQELTRLRTGIDIEGKRVDKRGFVSETVRHGLSTARSEFLLRVDHFGASGTVGPSGAAVLNEPYQAVKGHLRLFEDGMDCSKPAS